MRLYNGPENYFEHSIDIVKNMFINVIMIFNVSRYPRDINDVPGHTGDTRTLDKLIDGYNSMNLLYYILYVIFNWSNFWYISQHSHY